MKTGSKRPASAVQQLTQRTSSVQKQREKKKLTKLSDKKQKQAKLTQILETLQKQQAQTEESVDKSVYDSFHSSKDMGNVKKRQRQEMKAQKFKERQENAAADVEDEGNEDAVSSDEEISSDGGAPVMSSSGCTINDQDKRLQPRQSYDYIAAITEMYSNKKKKVKDDGDTSDEEIEMQGIKNHGGKREEDRRLKSVEDKRLAFINECDAKWFKNNEKSVSKGQSEDDFLKDDPDQFKTKTSKVRGLN